MICSHLLPSGGLLFGLKVNGQPQLETSAIMLRWVSNLLTRACVERVDISCKSDNTTRSIWKLVWTSKYLVPTEQIQGTIVEDLKGALFAVWGPEHCLPTTFIVYSILFYQGNLVPSFNLFLVILICICIVYYKEPLSALCHGRPAIFEPAHSCKCMGASMGTCNSSTVLRWEEPDMELTRGFYYIQ